MRPLLDMLADFAERTGTAALAIHHPPKSSTRAMHAFSGSLAFIAAPRLGFVVTREVETGRHLLLPVKNNFRPPDIANFHD